MKRLVTIVLALFLVSGAALAEPADAGKSLGVRTFQFKHKEADKAAAVIKALMSAEGTVSIQPATNAIVITDHASNLKAIMEALAKFDTPAQPFHLTVRLVAAARVKEGAATRVTEELKDVAAKLAMMRFNSFELLGDAIVVGKEGDPGIVTMETGYRADFRFGEYDPASDSIKLSDFKLSKLQADKSELTPLLKTTLNLKLGQTVILGASRLPDSQRALMIVVTAKR